jgi:hypothetical protein
MSFVIVKYIKPRVPVILLDSQGEVWEFNERDEADMYAEIFEANSDSGYKYVVKAIGESLDLED